MTNEITADVSGPIAESSRILGIDVVRGFALLGILMVNATFFSVPYGDLMEGMVPPDEGLPSKIIYWFTAIFCIGKFYPLFSILFGAGLAIIYESARRSGRNFEWIYLRRMVVLGLFGIVHIVFLWYGDILLLYATVGLSMLLLGRASPKILLWVAAAAFSFGIVTTLGFAALTTMSQSGIGDAEAVVPEMPKADSRIGQMGKVLTTWNESEAYDSRLTQLEREIQSQGPFKDAVVLRLFLYLFSMVYFIAITIWVVLPCFCIGAALMKTGFFHDSSSPWRKRLVIAGLFVGLPISILAAYAFGYQQFLIWAVIAFVGTNIGGPLMSLGYLSAILMLVERNPASKAFGFLANLGRMALSGYLLQSLLMSAIMSHWGLGLFGTTTWVQRAGIITVVFLAVLIFANVWIRAFRYGPMEWLWRSACYLKIQPLRRPSVATIE